VRSQDGSVYRIAGLAQDVTEQVQAELLLGERLKELGCLYQVLEITTRADLEAAQAYQEVADLLPGAWQHDSLAVARILVGAEEYRSPGWRAPVAQLTAMIDAGDGVPRSVEVGYVEACPDTAAGEGPFLLEERALLDGVATHLARMLYAHLMAESLNLAQRMDAVGQLTGGVAHDFNNLLTVILGNAELLREQLEAGSDHASIAASIGTAAQRGAELTHQLLAFARRQPLKPQAVDINRQLEGLDTMLRRTLGEHIDIVFACAGGVWDAMVDPTQLDSALVNLALNARDAMPQGGKLTIETANVYLSNEYTTRHMDLSPGQYVLVAVSDSGTGIAREHLARVFEPFYTTRTAGPGERRGTGLGLSMVYGFAKQSRGDVHIYSEPGEGTTVKLYLPRAVAARTAARQRRRVRAAGGRRPSGPGIRRRATRNPGLPRAHRQERRRSPGHPGAARRRGSAVHRHGDAGRHERPAAGRRGARALSGHPRALHLGLHRERHPAPRPTRARRAAVVQTLPPRRAGRRRAPGADHHVTTMTRRLLILDDDPLTGRTMQRIAEPQGLEVRCTTTADDFFETVDAWSPDVIILDLIMPGMDGVQVMARLAGHGCDAAIIITSGVGSRVLDAAGRAAEEHGLTITGILAKPFLPAALRSMLTKALEATPERLAEPAEHRAGKAEITRQDLERALDAQELVLVYQPKLHCQSGALAGFEALVRWQHPQLGVTGPDRFVPLAEREGLIDQLTRQVFDLALTWFADVCKTPAEQDGLSFQTRNSISLSLNVSAASLGNVALFDALEARCGELDLAPERIILELTETSAMEDPAASLAMMTRLRVHGFHLSIDDFGTGYSSMLQLVRLPFSEIKVDKSFVITAGSSQESRSVLRSVVDLGRSLGLKSTAEGVEDAVTLDYLRECGCDLAQGYHIARPLPAAEVLAWARAHDASRESQRLQALHALQVLDTPEEARFDRLTRLAQQIFRVPIALVSLVDERRQWFKSHAGLDVRETPRELSFCTHAIHHDEVMVVQDARYDLRFQDNPLVTGDPRIRFYAGCPLRLDDGSGIGTLCLIDTVPRFMGVEERTLLADLAALVAKELRSPAEVTDPASGLLVRRAFESRAGDLLSLTARLQQPATLLLVALSEEDADARSLARIGEALREHFRDAALLGRLDDTEFAVLMSDPDGERGSDARLRLTQAIASATGSLDADLRPRVRAGMASVLSGRKDLQALLAEADAAMTLLPLPAHHATAGVDSIHGV
jgi:EAL domain-containing protein (putative c-di-GMP-specific phosphodiesterase class I)/signal transduction histidine kinase/PleD family two-component response regulator